MNNLLKNIASNWKSGLSIAVVSVPLSLSFAIASGASPIMGLITSAWAGMVAALIGGSNFNVISPAGAFAGILTGISLQYGVEAIPIVTMLGAIFMFVGYLTNAHRFLRFIPGGAIFGFTLGIAAIIAGTQINSALGLSGLAKHDSILFTIAESLQNIGNLDVTSTVIFVVFLTLLFVVQKIFKKIPSIIIVTPFGLLLGWLATQNIIPLQFATLQTQYGELSASLLNIPSFTMNVGLIVPAITIAVVGILETMLSAKIADGLTKTRHNEKREMLGLSLANAVSGLVGGMPATGVLGPTVLNINTGAKNRTSAALKAFFVALITVLLFSLFKFMPMPVIAGILFFVAISMVQAKRFLLYYNHDRFSLAIAIIVAGITLYKNPALGILVGSVIGLLLFAEKVSRGSYEATHNSTKTSEKIHLAGEKKFSTHAEYDILVYTIHGVLSHLNADTHHKRLDNLEEEHVSHVVLRLRALSYIDIEGVETLDEIITSLKEKNTDVLITGINPHIESMLETHSDLYEGMKKDGKVYKKTRFALEALGVPPAPEDRD